MGDEKTGVHDVRAGDTPGKEEEEEEEKEEGDVPCPRRGPPPV